MTVIYVGLWPEVGHTDTDQGTRVGPRLDIQGNRQSGHQNLICFHSITIEVFLSGPNNFRSGSKDQNPKRQSCRGTSPLYPWERVWNSHTGGNRETYRKRCGNKLPFEREKVVLNFIHETVVSLVTEKTVKTGGVVRIVPLHVFYLHEIYSVYLKRSQDQVPTKSSHISLLNETYIGVGVYIPN